MEKKAEVLVVATMDTKAPEALYVGGVLAEQGVSTLIMDAGIMGTCPCPVAVTREEVARAAGKGLADVRDLGHEGQAMEIMISGAVSLARILFREGRIKGIIALGGSMGTTLGTGVMRNLPVGFPKVMISTMASRNTRAFVGTKDIMMLHSVCDLAGLNRVTRRVLRNGALALAGMVRGGACKPAEKRPLALLSTLGTIEACAVRVRQGLEALGYEVVTFHTVGSGGEAMDEMIRDGEVNAVVDLSLHEVADHLFDGDYDAGADRGKAGLRKGLPTVLVPGNIDFLSSGTLIETKRRFPNRRYHRHNAAITLVRTAPDEMAFMGRALGDICREATGPAAVVVPAKGFSVVDRENGPLHDPDGASVFVKALKEAFPEKIPLKILPCHINDPEFADAVISAFSLMLQP